MAQRPIWRGHIRLALVSCPVALYNARHERGSIRFNLINPVTGNRIRMVSQDAETGQEIARRDMVKGYEFEKDHYLLLDDADFESVKVESSSTMTVEKFVDTESVDPIYYDGSYYVVPDEKGSRDVFAVLREAISRTGKVALTRVVMSQRERTVAIRPMQGGLVAHTLNEERDLNDAGGLFEGLEDVKIDAEMVGLAVQLVDRQTGRYDPSDLEDRYETRLRAMIDAKLEGARVNREEEAPEPATNVVDLMAALKKSLGVAPAAKAEEVEKPAARAPRARKAVTPDEARRQQALKLPIEGGKKGVAKTVPVEVPVERPQPAPSPRRKAS